MGTSLLCDVLVIGAGAAGVRAAISAKMTGAEDVILLCKSAFGKGGATYYPLSYGWGMQAATRESDPMDSPEIHFQEIMAAAQGMCDEELARILAENAPRRAGDMLPLLGLPFDRQDDGHVYQCVGCYSTHKRCYQVTGVDMIRDRLRKAVDGLGIKVVEGWMATELLIEDGRCVGARALTAQQGDAVIRAGATVLATGGGTGLYAHHFATNEMTGDGLALALRAGCELANLEYVQISWGLMKPIGKVPFLDRVLYLNPEIGIDESELKGYPVAELLALRAKHHPYSVSDPSMWLDVAMFKKMRRTGEGVQVSLKGIPLNQLEAAPLWRMWYRWFDAKHDPLKQPMDIALHAHAFNGGVVVDRQAMSRVPGLFAAGEVMAGPHGADRLGGNMHATCQVFGEIAGRCASAFAQRHPAVYGEPPVQGPADGSGQCADWRIKELKERVRDLVWNAANVCRNQKDLTAALSEIRTMRQRWQEGGMAARNSQELQNMLLVSEALILAALERRESRGCHFREDHPAKDPNPYLVCIGMQEGEVIARRKEV